MSKYRRAFPRRNTLIIVVHVEGKNQALRNARIAQDEGADGVFLINHRIPYSELLRCYDHIKQSCPNLWIGLNFLDLNHSKALEVMPNDADGMWIDDAGIHEDSDYPTEAAKHFARIRSELNRGGIYFGGVAFKYQTPVRDPAQMAREAVQFVDVITTSSTGTGVAADVEKIRLMKKAIGNHPLAIASGITPENVAEYMPYTDCFLVATGVSSSPAELNPFRVRKLAQIISS